MAISPIGGAVNHTTSVVALATNYSPIAGNIVIVGVGTRNAGTPNTSAMSVQDNLSNFLTAGPAIADAGVATFKNVYLFYYTAPLGVTSFTASWTTTAGAVSVFIEEYSGAAGGVNPVGAATSVASTTANVSLVSTQANSFVSGVLYFPDNTNLGTLTSGNSQQSINISTFRGRLADNTAASSGTTVSLTNTLTAADWMAAAVELLPNISAGGPSNNSLMLLGCGI